MARVLTDAHRGRQAELQTLFGMVLGILLQRLDRRLNHAVSCLGLRQSTETNQGHRQILMQGLWLKQRQCRRQCSGQRVGRKQPTRLQRFNSKASILTTHRAKRTFERRGWALLRHLISALWNGFDRSRKYTNQANVCQICQWGQRDTARINPPRKVNLPC